MNMLTIGFVGSGQIAQAMIKGWTGNSEIEQLVYSKNHATKVADAFGIEARRSVLELWQDSDIVILAVPETGLRALAPQLQMAAMVKPSVIVTSVVDGVDFETLHQLLGEKLMITRALPNINVAVREGYTGLAFESDIDEEVKGAIAMLFLELGRADEYAEHQFGAVSALASAGPAYVASFADVLAHAAIENDIDIERAVWMVEQTLFGTATRMKKMQESPKMVEQAAAPTDSAAKAGLDALAASEFTASIKAAIQTARNVSEKNN
ncbi:pyrroline-5-carboxylate reductase family protein [Weissella minor]|uniref:pyrroline-5-carboxylate reductase family protein n=1 Tax=Weissella minor TaxID=1620 RepID=UPI0031FEEB5E